MEDAENESDTEVAEEEPSSSVDMQAVQKLGVKAQKNKKIQRQIQFIAAYKTYRDVSRACIAINISKKTYLHWRFKDKQWAEEFDALRAELEKVPEEGNMGDQYTLSVSGFVHWRKEYLKFDTPEFQRLMAEALIAMVTAEQKGQITLILVPPEHGKTTILEDFLTFLLCLDPQRLITLVSERQQHSVKMSMRIRNRLSSDGPTPEIPLHFGPFEPQIGDSKQPWATTFWSVFDKTNHDERDYTMATGGWKGAIAGTRSTDLIVDDIMSLRNYSQANQVLETFRQDMLSRPGVKGNTTVLGTRVGDDDFYEKLLDTGIVDHIVMLPAIDEDGNYLWPERYSPEDYKRLRRNVGDEAWWRNYQQKPRQAGTATFDDLTIEKMLRPFHHMQDPPKPNCPIYIGVDPAFGGQCVVTTVQHTPDGLWVRDQLAEFNLAQTETILSMIRNSILAHMDPENGVTCTDVVIEDNAAQKGLANDDRLVEMSEKFGFVITSHTTGYNKYDENIGIPQMANDGKRGKIHIPYADDGITKTKMEFLKVELERWKPRITGRKLRQDRVMSLWFCWIPYRQRTFYEDQQDDEDWSYDTEGSSGLLAGLGALIK